MDPEAISHQARAAITSLTAQLHFLETQQSALLHSLQLTTTTLSTLPNYTTIAPTLQQIPTYLAKLSRLKSTMAQQSHEVSLLKTRAEAARQKKLLHTERIKKVRERERELDRTLLRARVVSSSSSSSPSSPLLRPITPTSSYRSPTPTTAGYYARGTASDFSALLVGSPAPGSELSTPPNSQSGIATPTVNAQPTAETVKTVKRKRKPRQVEMG